MTKALSAEVLVPSADRLGEGVIWDDGTLRWIDLLNPRLHRWRNGDHAVTGLAVDPPLGAIARGPLPGELWLVHAAGVSPLNADTGMIGPLRAALEPARDGVALNDAKVAPDGALWFGSYDLAETNPRGALWRLEPGGRLDLIDAGFVVSNGPAFSTDGTAYFNASVECLTLSYHRGPQGRWTRDVLVRHEVPPDGLTVDAEGTLWIALYGGSAVTRHAPDGRRIGQVTLACPNVTACAFGGADLTTLFITTAREGTDIAQYPEAGHLFAVETGVPGRPEPRFTPR